MLTAVSASAQIEVADFENLQLPDNTYWCGELDEEDEDMGFSTSWFSSGAFDFNNFYWPDYDTWAFFAYSSRTEKTFKTVADDQCNSITGAGAGGSKIYGVAFPASYMGHTVMEVNEGETAAVIPGMEVVNTAWVVDCILNGDGFEGPFKTGDWFKLILTGYNDDEVTATEEYYLADFRSENEADHYYIDDWTWIDLSGLGEVTSVRFSIDSSKANSYGVTTPTYVCIDNVGKAKDSSSVNTVENPGFSLSYISSSRHVVVNGVAGCAGYHVTDISGTVVKKGQLGAGCGFIDLSALAKGIYMITVYDGNLGKSLKIVM